MSDQTKVAIIGCGRMGKIRADAVDKLGGLIVCVIDSNIDPARALAEQYNSTAFTSIDQLDYSTIDAVFYCVPPIVRGSYEQKAIDSGVAFFSEKPVGLNSAQLETTLAALADRPVPNAVGYMNRYRTGVQNVKEALRSQKPIAFNAQWVNGIYTVPWWREVSQSGGSLNEQCTHFIDLVRVLLGEITSVSAISEPHPDHPEIIGGAAMSYQTESGAVGTILYSCIASYKSMSFRVLTGTEEFVFDGWDLVPTQPSAYSEDAPADRNTIFLTETKAFLDAVRTSDQTHILCSLADAVATQQVVDATSEALATGETQVIKRLDLVGA